VTRLWLCYLCKRAGTCSDRPCCSSAVIAVTSKEQRDWYRLRIDAKPSAFMYDLVWYRSQPALMRGIVADHVARRGGEWVDGVAL
jgi:hypothetical protein